MIKSLGISLNVCAHIKITGSVTIAACAPEVCADKKVGQRQDWRYAILLYFFANAHCSATDEPGREAGCSLRHSQSAV